MCKVYYEKYQKAVSKINAPAELAINALVNKPQSQPKIKPTAWVIDSVTLARKPQSTKFGDQKWSLN